MKRWEDCTPAQQLERWENVLRVLKALTPHQRKKHFDMGTWAEQTECGTVACAAGHCGLDPWFRRRGLKIDFCNDRSIYAKTPFVHLVVSFFGHEGTSEIFLGTPDTYAEIVAAVKYYIKELKESAHAAV